MFRESVMLRDAGRCWCTSVCIFVDALVRQTSCWTCFWRSPSTTWRTPRTCRRSRRRTSVRNSAPARCDVRRPCAPTDAWRPYACTHAHGHTRAATIWTVGGPDSQLSETAWRANYDFESGKEKFASRARGNKFCTPVLTGSICRPTAHYAIFDASGSYDVVMLYKISLGLKSGRARDRVAHWQGSKSVRATAGPAQ